MRISSAILVQDTDTEHFTAKLATVLDANQGRDIEIAYSTAQYGSGYMTRFSALVLVATRKV